MNRLVRVSSMVALCGVAVEAFAAFLSVTPAAARLAPVVWLPFVVALVALAILATTLGKNNLAAGVLGVAAAAGIGAGMAVVPVAGAGVAFAAVLVVGELVAAGVVVAGGKEAVVTGASLFAAALVVTALACFGERIDVPSSTAGIAVGAAVAFLQLACARYADAAVTDRFGHDDVVAAAAARFVEAPRRMILALLGAQPL